MYTKNAYLKEFVVDNAITPFLRAFRKYRGIQFAGKGDSLVLFPQNYKKKYHLLEVTARLRNKS